MKRLLLVAILVMLMLLPACTGGGEVAPSPTPPHPATPPPPEYTPKPRPTLVPPSSPPPPSHGYIAFAAFHNGTFGIWQIHTMNADGSNEACLTHTLCNDLYPMWSPDGKGIAFASRRHGNWEICAMNADGSSQTRLTVGGQVEVLRTHLKQEISQAHNTHPTWSPDGRRIAFASGRDGNWEIYVMNTDESRTIYRCMICSFESPTREDQCPSCGAWFKFIETMIISQTRLTQNSAIDKSPAWSPDGNHIAFASDRDGNWEIYVMNADGSNQTRLTQNSAIDKSPAWSPDGRHIAFASNRDGNWEIYVMNADGSSQARLTHGNANNRYPTWSPDGQGIVFASDRDGNWEIYVMNADGSSQTRLTHSSRAESYPSWSP